MTSSNRRPWIAVAILAVTMTGLTPGAAHAVINGTASWLASHTVQIVTRAGRTCSGVVIGRTAVATAAHCAGSGAKIFSGGAPVTAASVSSSVVLEDGTRVSVSGDAAILRFTTPLPGFASPVTIGLETADGHFTVAGYGTTDEAHPGASGALHEASLVRAGPRRLIDPYRTGPIGASACFGDSGGPVLQGSMLVGIVTRASHTAPRIACGHLTHYAPIVRSAGATGSIAATVQADAGQQVSSRRARTSPAVTIPIESLY